MTPQQTILLTQINAAIIQQNKTIYDEAFTRLKESGYKSDIPYFKKPVPDQTPVNDDVINGIVQTIVKWRKYTLTEEENKVLDKRIETAKTKYGKDQAQAERLAAFSIMRDRTVTDWDGDMLNILGAIEMKGEVIFSSTIKRERFVR